MNRKLNVTLLVILGAVGMLSAVSIYMIHGWQVSRNADASVKRADELLKEGDPRKASKQRLRYVKIRPNDIEQRRKLIEDCKAVLKMIDVEAKDYMAVRSVYNDAIMKIDMIKFDDGSERSEEEQRAAFDEEIRSGYVEMAFEFRDYGLAKEQLLVLLEGRGEEDDLDLRIKLAKCQSQLNEHDEAEKLLAEIIGYDSSASEFTADKTGISNDVDAFLQLAGIYLFQMNRPEDARNVISQLVKVNPNSSRAHLEYGKFIYENSDETDKDEVAKALEQAKVAIAKAAELDPDDVEVLLVSAKIAMSEGQYDDADSLFTKAVAMYPTDERIYLAQLQLALRQRVLPDITKDQRDAFTAKAKERIATGLKTLTDRQIIMLLWWRGRIELDEKDDQAVRKTMDELERINVQRHFIDYFDACLDLSNSNWEQAARKFEKVRPMILGWPQESVRLSRFLATCYSHMGYTGKMLEAYDGILDRNPADHLALEGKMDALNRLGRSDDAREVADLLKQLYEKYEVDVPFLTLQKNLMLEIARQKRLNSNARDWTEADALLTLIMANESMGPAQKVMLQTNVASEKGDNDRALQIIRKGLENKETKNDQRLYFMLANLMLVQERDGPNRALKVTAAIKKRFGDSLGLRLAKAKYLFYRRGDSLKEDLLGLAENDIGQFSPAEMHSIYELVGQYLQAVRAYDDTRRYWKKVAAGRPQAIPIRLALFQLALLEGRADLMEEALVELETAEGGQGISWKLAQAKYLLWQLHQDGSGDVAITLNRVKKLAADITSVRTEWGELYNVQAQVALLENDSASLIKWLELSAMAGVPNAAKLRPLVELLIKSGRFEDAQKQLARLSDLQRTQLHDLQIMVLVSRNQFGEALSISTKLVAHSQKIEDHIQHAQLLMLLRKIPAAEAALLRAVELAPTHEAVRLALVQLYSVTNRKSDVEAQIREIETTIAGNRLPLLLGQCYQLLGDMGEAERNFELAVENAPDSVETLRKVAAFYLGQKKSTEAKKHLDAILAIASSQEAAERIDLAGIAWARRELAKQVAASGSYPDYVKAMELIDTNTIPGRQIAPSDLLVKTQLALARRDRNSHEQAISWLDSQKRSLTLSEDLVRAQLYENVGRWDDCRRVMLDLLGKQPNNPSIIVPYIAMLLKNDQQLGLIEQQIRKLDPKSLTTRVYQVHVAAKKGNVNETVQLVDSMLPKPITRAQYRAVLSAAQLFEKVAAYHDEQVFYAQAEKLFKGYVQILQNQLGAQLNLAAFWGRRGRVSEALDIYEKAFADENLQMSALQLAKDSLGINRDKLDPNGPEFNKVVQWFEAAAAKIPDSKVLLWHRAELEDIRGNHQEVVAIYQKYLQRSDVKPNEAAVIRNNLAFVYALLGEGSNALRLVDQSIKHLGPTADLLDTRGMAFLAQKNTSKAISELTQSIQGGETAVKQFHLALAYEQAGDMTSASQAFARANELGLVAAKDLSQLEIPRYEKLSRAVAQAVQKVSAAGS